MADLGFQFTCKISIRGQDQGFPNFFISQNILDFKTITRNAIQKNPLEVMCFFLIMFFSQTTNCVASQIMHHQLLKEVAKMNKTLAEIKAKAGAATATLPLNEVSNI